MFSHKHRIISRSPPTLESIQIIENNFDAENASRDILTLADRVPFVGLDCEWVGTNQAALLQIAVFDSEFPKCYLFRLSKFDKSPMPILSSLLNSRKITKLGVGIDGDFQRLISEGFSNTENDSYIDLRFLAAETSTCIPGGLASLVTSLKYFAA